MHSNFDDNIRSAMSNHVTDDGNADAVWAEMAPKIKVGASSTNTGLTATKAMFGVLTLAIVSSVAGYFALSTPDTMQVDASNISASQTHSTQNTQPTTPLLSDTIKKEEAKEHAESTKSIELNENTSPENVKVAESTSKPPVKLNESSGQADTENIAPIEVANTQTQHTPEVHWSKDTYCVHEMAACSIVNPIENARYTWTFSDGTTLEGRNVEKRMNATGEFTGTVAVTVNEGITTQHELSTVTVTELPKVKFNSSPSTNPREAAITFTAYTSHMGTFFWRFGDKYTSTDEKPAHRYSNKGIYQVTLVFTSNMGCTDSVKRMVRVHKAYNLMAESVFDPSKETWMPAGLKDPNTTFELQVYTDNGTPVFKTTNCEDVWDGRNTVTGDIAEVGTMYIWVASVLNESGVQEKYSGTILVTNKP